jgi:hypothetical protein
MKHNILLFFEYLLKETGKIQVYVTAGIIGCIICSLTDTYSVIPFIVPLLVQILVRSNARFRQRHESALVELPAQKDDPVFIMDMQGNIVLSVGKTKELFEKYGVERITDFISQVSFNRILESVSKPENYIAETDTLELFSERSLKWYEVKAKQTGIKYGSKEQKLLVWFQNISFRKIYYLRLQDLLRYSDSLIEQLHQPRKRRTAYEHFASFLLKEYEAVFITRTDRENNLTGFAFRRDINLITQSESITIQSNSLAPINVSRKMGKIITDDRSYYKSDGEFMEQNRFDKKVLSFVEVPIRNFITFNEDDVSIIAFNFRSKITAHEQQFFKIVVNIYRTMVMLVDLKEKS